jgi:enamine deaminase RidA (YjgF/YER057c/UK114 family)
MKNKFINPSTLFDSTPLGFTQVVTSKRKKLVLIAGQTAWDRERNLIGAGDLRAQLRASFQNVGLALEAAGAGRSDVVQMRMYLVNHRPENLDIIVGEIQTFYNTSAYPANTLIGVQALALPEFLCEIEVMAAID